MAFRAVTWWSAALGLALLAGCFYPVRDRIDTTVRAIAKQPFDPQILQPADPVPHMPAAENGPVKPAAGQPEEPLLVPPMPLKGPDVPRGRAADLPGDIPQAIRVPSHLLPGGRGPAPGSAGPKLGPLPAPGPDPEPLPGPEGCPLTLAELQRIGLSNSPAIRQAAAHVEAMRGAAVQAGLWPNPTVGFEVDTFGTTGGAGYAGGYVDQLIKTGNKLGLARAAAAMDLRNAEVALRRARMDLARNVRAGYFAVLVARENMRMNRTLYGFLAGLYEYHVGQLPGGQVNPRDSLYVQALANTALTLLVNARTRYVAAWKTLAANMGVPGMPPTQLAGSADMPVPVFEHERVLAHVLRHHTDVATAENRILQARFNQMLAEVQPIPDVGVRFLMQKDYTGAPNAVTPSLQVSVPLPVWNRNQGGIVQAQANLTQMSEEPHRVRSELTARLAGAFATYQSSRLNLVNYRDRILPALIRVYTGTLQEHYQVGANAAFTDVVVAQQTLAGGIATYLTLLGEMWQSVVDVADLVQTDDLFQVGGEALPAECVAAGLDLEHLPRLPCRHPCSPLHDPRLQGGDGTWPPPLPSPTPTMPRAAARLPERPAALPDVGAAAEAPSPRRLGDPKLAEPPPRLPQPHTQ